MNFNRMFMQKRFFTVIRRMPSRQMNADGRVSLKNYFSRPENQSQSNLSVWLNNSNTKAKVIIYIFKNFKYFIFSFH